MDFLFKFFVRVITNTKYHPDLKLVSKSTQICKQLTWNAPRFLPREDMLCSLYEEECWCLWPACVLQFYRKLPLKLWWFYVSEREYQQL